jgi:hypothetical protein
MEATTSRFALVVALLGLTLGNATAQTTTKSTVKTTKPAVKAPAATTKTTTKATTAKPAAAPAPAPAPAPAEPATRPASTRAARTGPFEEGTNALNLGIGIGSVYSFGAGFFGGSSSVSPAISVSYERGIRPIGPGILGIGGYVGYQGASYDLGGGDKIKYSDILVTVRGAFHYPVTAEFDAYGGVAIGVRHGSTSYEGDFFEDVASDSYNDFVTGVFAGGRYFFTDNIGAFGEVGYDQSFLKVGLTAKF